MRKKQAEEMGTFQLEQFTQRVSAATAVQSRWKESLTELNDRIFVLEDMRRRAQESLSGCEQNLADITKSVLREVIVMYCMLPHASMGTREVRI